MGEERHLPPPGNYFFFTTISQDQTIAIAQTQLTRPKKICEDMSLNFTKHGSRDHKKMVLYAALRQMTKEKP